MERGCAGRVKQSIHPCYLLLKESGVTGENYEMGVRSPDREERRGKRCSQGTPVPPRTPPPLQAAHSVFSLPSSGLLEGIPLSLSLPELDHIYLGVLRDS